MRSIRPTWIGLTDDAAALPPKPRVGVPSAVSGEAGVDERAAEQERAISRSEGSDIADI
jgi:hypothetical protein